MMFYTMCISHSVTLSVTPSVRAYRVAFHVILYSDVTTRPLCVS